MCPFPQTLRALGIVLQDIYLQPPVLPYVWTLLLSDVSRLGLHFYSLIFLTLFLEVGKI